MPDNKQKCKTCKQRHLLPTGKKCQNGKQQESAEEHLRDAAVSSEDLRTVEASHRETGQR